MALLPLSVGLALVGLESVEMTLIEAGRVLQDDRRVLFRVIIPTVPGPSSSLASACSFSSAWWITVCPRCSG